MTDTRKQKTATQLAAERYWTLQSMAMLKLHDEGRLNELPNGPIDPAVVFTPAELRCAIEEVNRRIT